MDWRGEVRARWDMASAVNEICRYTVYSLSLASIVTLFRLGFTPASSVTLTRATSLTEGGMAHAVAFVFPL